MQINKRDYPTLHTETQLKGNKQLVVRKDMDVNEHEKLSNITLRHSLKLRNNQQRKKIWMEINMRDYTTLHLDTN